MIIGIDPALHNVGWAIVANENDKTKLIDSGVISTKKSQSLDVMWHNIIKTFNDIIIKHPITHCAIETPFVNMNPKTSLTLGIAKGICLSKFAENSIPISIYTPSQIKKTIAGNGKAEKTQVEYIVKQILNLDVSFKKLDESDACAVAITKLIDMQKY
jgi:crossover junction endodeoxyribonuclease RuvC